MEITLESFTKTFDETVSTESKELIESLYVFGSLARGEKIQIESDIDSVLLLNNKDQVSYMEMMKLSGDLIKLDKALGVVVDHVFCTQDDLFELISPTLIVNLHIDGINIYGKDLKQRFSQYLSTCTKPQLLNSFLRTDMFRRQQLRKKYIKLDLNNTNNIDNANIFAICKDVILTARDLLYFDKEALITPKKEICSYFLANFSGSDEFVNTPILSYNVRYGAVELRETKDKLDYLRRAFNFMEVASILIQTKYKQITGKTKLDLKPF